MDSKEPKEKHVICKEISKKLTILDLLECMNGEHKDSVSTLGTIKFIFDRHSKHLDNWAINTKVFIILHRAL